MKNLKKNWFFSSHKTLLIISNLLASLIFAILYYLMDYIISYYPNFSEKYLLQELNKSQQKNSNNQIFTLKPPLYYLWFSLITQTTVGYTGMLSLDNKSLNFVHMRSTPFKILNIIQLLSILIIPALIYSD